MMAAIGENCWTDRAALAMMSAQQTPGAEAVPPRSSARAGVWPPDLRSGGQLRFRAALRVAFATDGSSSRVLRSRSDAAAGRERTGHQRGARSRSACCSDRGIPGEALIYRVFNMRRREPADDAAGAPGGSVLAGLGARDGAGGGQARRRDARRRGAAVRRRRSSTSTAPRGGPSCSRRPRRTTSSSRWPTRSASTTSSRRATACATAATTARSAASSCGARASSTR